MGGGGEGAMLCCCVCRDFEVRRHALLPSDGHPGIAWLELGWLMAGCERKSPWEGSACRRFWF